MLEYATKRDQCWNALISKIVKSGADGFLLRDAFEEADFEDMNYATIRRTARGMQECHWLARPSEKAQRWFVGYKGTLLLPVEQPEPNLTEYSGKAIKRDRCWNVLLKEIAEDGGDGFLLRNIHERNNLDINYTTLRRTARGMQELGWLQRHSKKAQRWHAGSSADTLLATIKKPDPETVAV